MYPLRLGNRLGPAHLQTSAFSSPKGLFVTKNYLWSRKESSRKVPNASSHRPEDKHSALHGLAVNSICKA